MPSADSVAARSQSRPISSTVIEPGTSCSDAAREQERCSPGLALPNLSAWYSYHCSGRVQRAQSLPIPALQPTYRVCNHTIWIPFLACGVGNSPSGFVAACQMGAPIVNSFLFCCGQLLHYCVDSLCQRHQLLKNGRGAAARPGGVPGHFPPAVPMWLRSMSNFLVPLMEASTSVVKKR